MVGVTMGRNDTAASDPQRAASASSHASASVAAEVVMANESKGVTAQIESVWGYQAGSAHVWIASGDMGYRVTLPVDLAAALVAALQ